jgi:hypothetical protein
MSILIVVEDGSIVAGANSYVSLAEVKDYFANRAYSVPVDDETTKAAMILSLNFIESFRAKFKGCKKDAAQALQFPRTRLRLDGYPVNDNAIPTVLKWAQCEATYKITQSEDLQPNLTAMTIKAETVGPITTEYSDVVQTSTGRDVVTTVESLLAPLFVVSSAFGRFGRP